jgi:NAD(P)-dependent dehydrogenase (short-subunit alcohol dehydrogenase family)
MGIGKAAALQLAREGARVVLVERPEKEPGEISLKAQILARRLAEGSCLK